MDVIGDTQKRHKNYSIKVKKTLKPAQAKVKWNEIIIKQNKNIYKLINLLKEHKNTFKNISQKQSSKTTAEAKIKLK